MRRSRPQRYCEAACESAAGRPLRAEQIPFEAFADLFRRSVKPGDAEHAAAEQIPLEGFADLFRRTSAGV